MKYLKRFETNSGFNIGDLVYHIKKYKNAMSANTYNKYLEYIENNIGKIIYIVDNEATIIYEDIPDSIKPFFIQHRFGENATYCIDSRIYDLSIVPPEQAESFKNRKIEKNMKKYNL